MTKPIKYEFLKMIDTKSSINNLVAIGLSYSQIAIYIQEAMTEGIIEVINDVIVCSDIGKHFLEDYEILVKKRKNMMWIDRRVEYIRTPMKKGSIRLPKRI